MKKEICQVVGFDTYCDILGIKIEKSDIFFENDKIVVSKQAADMLPPHFHSPKDLQDIAAQANVRLVHDKVVKNLEFNEPANNFILHRDSDNCPSLFSIKGIDDIKPTIMENLTPTEDTFVDFYDEITHFALYGRNKVIASREEGLDLYLGGNKSANLIPPEMQVTALDVCEDYLVASAVDENNKCHLLIYKNNQKLCVKSKSTITKLKITSDKKIFYLSDSEIGILELGSDNENKTVNVTWLSTTKCKATDFSVSSDSKFLAAIEDKTIKVYSLPLLKLIDDQECDNRLTSIDFCNSKYSTGFAVGDNHGVLKFCYVAPLLRPQQSRTCSGLNHVVFIRHSLDDTHLIVGYANFVKIYNLNTGAWRVFKNNEGIQPVIKDNWLVLCTQSNLKFIQIDENMPYHQNEYYLIRDRKHVETLRVSIFIDSVKQPGKPPTIAEETSPSKPPTIAELKKLN